MRLKLSLSIIALAASTSAVAASPAFLVGTGEGSLQARVAVFDTDAQLVRDISPYPGFNGGVRVASGDVNGDGVADIVTGAGPGGGPHVKAFDGANGSTLHDFFAYDAQFKGGVYVAAGDLNGDGRADVVTGTGAGAGPNVKVFSGADGSLAASFFAFDPGFIGGVRVATGDFGGDGRSDLIVGAGPGGSSHVKIFDGLTSTLQASFFAYDTAFNGGVALTTGRYLGENALFVGAGEGGGGQVKAFSLTDGRLLAAFIAFDSRFAGDLSLGFARIAGRDTLLVGMASRGGTLGMLDVTGRGGRDRLAASDAAFSYLTPFGTDYTDGLSVAGLTASIPETASWAMMIAGFGMLGSTARRKRVYRTV